MKKIAFGLLLMAVSAYAGITKLTKIGPTSSLSQYSTAEQASTIAAGGSGVRNCLTSLSVTSSSHFTLRILNAGTTVYAIDVSTSLTTTGGGGAIFDKRWDEDDMCGSAASAMTVKITTATTPVATSTQKLNYSGFTY